jgi:hypothetical protein
MHVLKVIESVWSNNQESLTFICGDVRDKSNRSREVRRSLAPCFLYAELYM